MLSSTVSQESLWDLVVPMVNCFVTCLLIAFPFFSQALTSLLSLPWKQFKSVTHHLLHEETKASMHIYQTAAYIQLAPELGWGRSAINKHKGNEI